MPALLGPRLLVICAIWLTLVPRAAAQTVPLATNANHGDYVLPTPNPADQYYLVVGSLADATHSTKVRLRTEASEGPDFLPVENTVPDSAWKTQIEAQAHWLERQRHERLAFNSFPRQGSAPPSKSFNLFTGERDLEDSHNYQTVQADLCALGRRAQVYVDRADRKLADMNRTVAEVLRLFDEEIGPWAEQHLGRVADIDRDGRFTILLTGKLGAMQNGKVQIDGFVRGSDFFRELPAPFSNHCDMLYLNAGLKPGPHLRTVMFHEYTHAITFCEHALTSYRDGPNNQDEDSWLNEGISHLVENPAEHGWSNLDRRVSAYLAAPQRYPLVVADYFGSGLWRDPGTRGATFLFLRSCQTQSDDDLTRRLIQSPLHGVANLEAAMQKPFAEAFRQAAVDLLSPCNYGYLAKDKKDPFLCGPQYLEVPLENGQAEQTLAGTADAFFLLHSPTGAHARLHVDADGPVQLTLVRRPNQTPRLSLSWENGPDGLRLLVTAHDGDVHLRAAGWESASDQPYALCFADTWVRAGATLRSFPLVKPMKKDAEALFKIWAEDALGRPLAGWISLKP